MAKNEKIELNSLEIKNLLHYAASNNVRLAKNGEMPIAYEIEGMPGTAKTSVAKQVAEELDCYYVRLNLAEIDVCDLVGLPVYEYKVRKGKEEKWVSDKILSYYITTLGYEPLPETRTSYSKPIWIHGKEDKPIFLVLDDYNRVFKIK